MNCKHYFQIKSGGGGSAPGLSYILLAPHGNVLRHEGERETCSVFFPMTENNYERS